MQALLTIALGEKFSEKNHKLKIISYPHATHIIAIKD